MNKQLSERQSETFQVIAVECYCNSRQYDGVAYVALQNAYGMKNNQDKIIQALARKGLVEILDNYQDMEIAVTLTDDGHRLTDEWNVLENNKPFRRNVGRSVVYI